MPLEGQADNNLSAVPATLTAGWFSLLHCTLYTLFPVIVTSAEKSEKNSYRINSNLQKDSQHYLPYNHQKKLLYVAWPFVDLFDINLLTI